MTAPDLKSAVLEACGELELEDQLEASLLWLQLQEVMQRRPYDHEGDMREDDER